MSRSRRDPRKASRGREYWSRRKSSRRGGSCWGSINKDIDHRYERREGKEQARKEQAGGGA